MMHPQALLLSQILLRPQMMHLWGLLQSQFLLRPQMMHPWGLLQSQVLLRPQMMRPQALLHLPDLQHLTATTQQQLPQKEAILSTQQQQTRPCLQQTALTFRLQSAQTKMHVLC